MVRPVTLLHEQQHRKDFHKVAQGIASSAGSRFFAEYVRLEGDPERIEKLRKRFPRETDAYVEELSDGRSVKPQTGTDLELAAFARERRFYDALESELNRICPR